MTIIRALGGMVRMTIVRPLPIVLAAALIVAALGCGAFSLPSLSKATPTPEWQRSTAEIHDIPVTGENIGVEVGKHVPPFALGLVDGSIVTSADLLDASQPTFLFFWATT